MLILQMKICLKIEVKLVRECVGNALASGENVTQQQLNIIAHYKNDGLDTTAWENYKFDRDRLEQISKRSRKKC